MKLFLASLACQSLDLVRPILPASPSQLSVVVIPTAADTYESHPWVENDKEKLKMMGFNITEYDIKGKNEQKLTHDLAIFDGIFVAGGNTFFLLNHMRLTGFDKVLLQLLRKNKVYIGSSAGSIILGPDLEHIRTLDHPEAVPELADTQSLGIIKDRIVPHYGRKKYLDRHKAIEEKWGPQITFLTDDEAIVVDGSVKKIVTAKHNDTNIT